MGLTEHRVLADHVAAVFAVALDTVLFTQLTESGGRGGFLSADPHPAVIVAAALVALPALLLRRRWPFATCLVVAGHAGLVTLAIGSRPLAGPLLALFTAAAWTAVHRAGAALAAVLSAHALAVAYEASTVATTAFAVAAVATVFVLLDVSAWAFGRRAFGVRERTRILEESRAALAAEAVARERLRIARELHDIVAHAVTIMVLQAAGARRAVGRAPDQAATALEVIEDTGKQAVAELRRLLTVLRSVDDRLEEGPPGQRYDMAGIAALAARAEATGLQVTVTEAGDVRELDPSVELAAYRIVQEALTNSTRHAGPGADVAVRLGWSTDALVVEVTDDGGGRPAPAVSGLSSGYGFAGLAERVKLVGGQFTAGPRTTADGYHVRAVLPVRSAVDGSMAAMQRGRAAT